MPYCRAMETIMRHDRKRPGRRIDRRPGTGYVQAGAYFRTVCTHEKALLFEDP